MVPGQVMLTKYVEKKAYGSFCRKQSSVIEDTENVVTISA